MTKFLDKDLYEKAKDIIYKQYEKPSAYRSGALVKKYKELGGRFQDDGVKKLKNWYKEKWTDVGNKDYPVYRPTKRINKDTPLLVSEIDKDNLKKQIELKQKIKGQANLPPFLPKDISEFSNFDKVKKNAIKFGYNPNDIFISSRKDKKYMILHDGKYIHFGQMFYEDFTKHNDEKRRQDYLARATKIKGDWKDDKYSPNNLAIKLLWQ